MITIKINPNLIDDYQKFIDCKKLPKYEIKGDTIYTDEISYNSVFKNGKLSSLKTDNNRLFDYQAWVVNKALEKKRFAAYLNCGLGKTWIITEFMKIVSVNFGKALILCPLSVLQEFENISKEMGISITNLRKIGVEKDWEGIAIVNYEGCYNVNTTNLKAIALDECSILKNGEGKTKKYLVNIAKGVPYRLAASATPSPNYHAEYATQAVWLGYVNSEKEFYSRFFRKDGTNWILKSHAVSKFYEYLTNYSCYIYSPSSLGFEQGAEMQDEPNYIEIECKDPNNISYGESLFGDQVGMKRAGEIFRYRFNKDSDRFKKSVKAIEGKRAIIWCIRNAEEEVYHKNLENSALITGKTSPEKRIEIIEKFKAGEIQYLISKPKILGWGVNIQEADCHLYSGYDFGFEAFFQAVRRSHRFPRKDPLDVYIPIMPCERPVYEILRKKLSSFNDDIKALQGRFFKKSSND